MAEAVRLVSCSKLFCSNVLRAFRDPDYSNFEFAYFLTGTHNDEETTSEHKDYINLLRLRIPKIHQSQKNTIDYTVYDRASHSKAQVVRKIEHEGEVMKCR